MNLTTDSTDGVSVVHVHEERLMYPLLSDFVESMAELLTGTQPKVLLDLSAVNYIDSATIGCLMDLYRQAAAAGGSLKLAGVQARVATMLTMTGAQHFLEMHPDTAAGLASFGA